MISDEGVERKQQGFLQQKAKKLVIAVERVYGLGLHHSFHDESENI